jgi:hypothetical protein
VRSLTIHALERHLTSCADLDLDPAELFSEEHPSAVPS